MAGYSNGKEPLCHRQPSTEAEGQEIGDDEAADILLMIRRDVGNGALFATAPKPKAQYDKQGHQVYEVQRIWAATPVKPDKPNKYLIQWVGLPMSKNTWEPASYIERTCPLKVDEYKAGRL